MTVSTPDASRTGVRHPFLPAPLWHRAGDFVFVSSLYPDPVTVPPANPWTGPSQAELQAGEVLDALSAVLDDAGSSLAGIARIEIELADPSDFVDVKRVLAERLGQHPPAQTTIVVGDEHPVPGARLALHAVAVADDAPVRPTAVVPEGLPDPVPAAHAAWAVRADPFVFCSGFPATDFATGVTGKDTSGFYNEFAARHQALEVLSALAATLTAAGSSLDRLVKVQFYEPDLRTFPIVDAEWGKRVGLPPTRSSMGCRGLLVPGASWAVNTIAVVADAPHRRAESREGLRWHPGDLGKAHFTPGLEFGPWFFTAGQFPVPDFGRHDWVRTPPGLPYHWSDIEVQTDFTLELISGQVEANGLRLSDAVDAKVYLVDPRRDVRGFSRSWQRHFADGGPALSLIPSTQEDGSDGVMIQGPLIEIDLTFHRR